jgi:hypothetical protein
MINSLSLNKITFIILIFLISIFDSVNSEEPVDIWQQNESQETVDQNKNETDEDSLIVIDNTVEKKNLIEEEEVDSNKTIVGLFDPAINDFTLEMWTKSDGIEVKKVISRISKLKLSKFSQEMLFQTLFTNSYPPNKNLTADDFLNIKIDWLIENKKIKDLERLLETNTQVGKKTKAIRFLIEEHLSSANIKLACEKVKFKSKEIKNNYLEKFNIYCLYHEERKGEAQLMLDLLKESGFKDNFYEKKINFLLGTTNETSQKINDKDLFNFYLSQITSKNFEYQPTEKTKKNIWKYLSSANLIKVENFDDEEIIATYEKASASGTFEKKEIFNIYKKIPFNLNQLLNALEIYKTLPNYKSRALIYQKILLTENIEKKLYLVFLLKDLFINDNLLDVFSDELSTILLEVDSSDIPESYKELVDQYSISGSQSLKNIKFDNDIIHKSKTLKYFIDDDYSTKKAEKDIKNVYKKVRKNKKYFISIKDIIILESLQNEGIDLPETLKFTDLQSTLTVPKGLYDLADQQQIGLTMLKIVEIIGEDKIEDLDPETLYFIIKILNKLKLNKIRNNIISKVFPERV